MNGEPLPFEHGFPARLVVSGLYGYVSATKWLREIEITEWDAFDAYWIPRGWAKVAPIKLQSRIDTGTGQIKQKLEDYSQERIANILDWQRRYGIPVLPLTASEESVAQLRRLLGIFQGAPR